MSVCRGHDALLLVGVCFSFDEWFLGWRFVVVSYVFKFSTLMPIVFIEVQSEVDLLLDLFGGAAKSVAPAKLTFKRSHCRVGGLA